MRGLGSLRGAVLRAARGWGVRIWGLGGAGLRVDQNRVRRIHVAGNWSAKPDS